MSPRKHSFCAWLAFQNRLPTSDRIRGSEARGNLCCWCYSAEETAAHLFFSCPESSPISEFMEFIGVLVQWSSWMDVYLWFNSFTWPSKGLKDVAAFLINLTIYEGWRNRNSSLKKGIYGEIEAAEVCPSDPLVQG
ncbi:hypothetical protein QQ045_015099 [Rhodiola kirilowii]